MAKQKKTASKASKTSKDGAVQVKENPQTTAIKLLAVKLAAIQVSKGIESQKEKVMARLNHLAERIQREKTKAERIAKRKQQQEARQITRIEKARKTLARLEAEAR